MRGLVFLCFILTVPLVAVLGHDIWHAYNSKGGIDFSHPFPFSDTGWLWTTYAKDSYDMAHGSIDDVTWNAFIDPILKTRAVIVFGLPALAAYGLLGLLRLLGIGPFHGKGLLASVQLRKKGPKQAAQPKTRGAVKYKRK